VTNWFAAYCAPGVWLNNLRYALAEEHAVKRFIPAGECNSGQNNPEYAIMDNQEGSDANNADKIVYR
jgi:hypothetical protein